MVKPQYYPKKNSKILFGGSIGGIKKVHIDIIAIISIAYQSNSNPVRAKNFDDLDNTLRGVFLFFAKVLLITSA